MTAVERASRRNRSLSDVARAHYLGTPCPYCGGTMTPASHWDDRGMTRDHVLPLSRGGADRGDNVVVVCRACNELKGELLLTEWLELTLEDGDPRAARLALILDRLPKLRRACEAVTTRERQDAECRL